RIDAEAERVAQPVHPDQARVGVRVVDQGIVGGGDEARGRWAASARGQRAHIDAQDLADQDGRIGRGTAGRVVTQRDVEHPVRPEAQRSAVVVVRVVGEVGQDVVAGGGVDGEAAVTGDAEVAAHREARDVDAEG